MVWLVEVNFYLLIRSVMRYRVTATEQLELIDLTQIHANALVINHLKHL